MNFVFVLFVAQVSLFFAVMLVKEASLYFQASANSRRVRYSVAPAFSLRFQTLTRVK